MAEPNSTNPAEWAAAIGTVGALLVSMRLWRGSLVERRRSQAALVAAWSNHDFGSSEDKEMMVEVELRNASSEPVYQLRLRVGPMLSGRKLRNWRFFHVVPPGGKTLSFK